MKNFAKELNAYLAGPPRILQSDFADATGVNKSKLSRLLNATIPMDRPTLDAILSGVTNPESRSRLVAAYIRDVASPMALSYLKGQQSEQPWAEIEALKLSRKGQLALKTLLQSDCLPQVERMLLDLATIAGIRLP